MNIIGDISQYLQAQGVGTENTDLFLTNYPDSPDDLVMIKDTGGMKPDVYIPTGLPTFQIIVRNTDYTAGKTKLDEIVALLHHKANVQLVEDGIYFYYINLMSEPAPIGRDEKEREEFSVNFETKVRGR